MARVETKECIKFTKEDAVQVVSVRELLDAIYEDGPMYAILGESRVCYNILTTRNWIAYNGKINAWKNRRTKHWEVDLNSVIAYCKDVLQEREIVRDVHGRPEMVALQEAEDAILAQYHDLVAKRESLFDQLKDVEMMSVGLA